MVLNREICPYFKNLSFLTNISVKRNQVTYRLPDIILIKIMFLLKNSNMICDGFTLFLIILILIERKSLEAKNIIEGHI